MAEFACLDCSYEAHFTEFKTGTHSDIFEGSDEVVEVDDVECPVCGSDAVYEL